MEKEKINNSFDEIPKNIYDNKNKLNLK